MNRRVFLKLTGAGIGWAGLGPALLAETKAEIRKTDPFYSGKKFVVAHRGASAYAPENTLPAYELAIKQGADYVEQDLQISRDGVLICCHDLLLNRLTNVQQVFPDRYKEEVVKGEKVKKWYIHDFDIKEIKQLDAGSHLDPKFKGVTIPTWQEAIDTIRGKAGLCPETKGPEYYGKLGFDMEAIVMAVLKKKRSRSTQEEQCVDSDLYAVLQQGRPQETAEQIRDEMADALANVRQYQVDARHDAGSQTIV